MGSLTAERLYDLLPAIYRIRDAEQGEPLRELLGMFAREFAALEENVDQLYDDQFIETCAEWITPYIGDLIGYRPLHGASPRISSPRAEVAHTIAFRRRKGTALMLEELAHDVTDWPARAVEFFQQLATTQYMKHLRLEAPATADLRDVAATLRVDGPFNTSAHTAEVRRPETGVGRYNIPNVGIFLWRLRALRLSAIPLTADPNDGTNRKFRFNPLGADMRLFRREQTEEDISHLAEPINVPDPLTVRLMALAVRDAQKSSIPAPDQRPDDDYGPGESITLYKGSVATPLPVAKISVCDLRDILDSSGNVIGWNHEGSVPAGIVGIDPERGRVLLGAAADGPLLATFHYGQARAIGGGEYERTPLGLELSNQRTVDQGGALQAHLNAIASGGRLLIRDSYTYVATPTFKADDFVVVAAADSARPLVAAGGDMVLQIGPGGRLVLDGLVLSGGALRLAASGGTEERELLLRDCTLVPGGRLNPDGSPVSAGAISLKIEDPTVKVVLQRCIVGAIRAVSDAEIVLQDCVVDAGAPENVAFEGTNAGDPGAELTIQDCTIIGKVHTRLMRLASDSIFLASLRTSGETWQAPLVVQRKQQGCIRFSFVPAGSITPRRFKCVPGKDNPDVRPYFTSLRYCDPGYCQLRRITDQAIREGASDGGEMGVLHPLLQPQREINLRIRLDEYLRFGLHAGIFYST
jgi:hypothetical protein